MPRTATADRVDRDELLAFLRPRHKALLMTRRGDGSPQLSPVTCGVDESGRVVVSTYPQRAKVVNARRDPRPYAEQLHDGLPVPEDSVLVLCDPRARALEIVTGSRVRRVLDDYDCRLAAMSMQSSFRAGDVIGGLVNGVQQLGQSARHPETLHSSRQG